MLILLLPFLALLHSSRPATEFDATRCDKEMACFIPDSCVQGQETSREFSRDKKFAIIDGCAGVVAIRAYSLTKWLVAMRGKGVDAQGIKLSITVGSQSPQLMFECKPNGDKAQIEVAPDMTKGTEYSLYFNEAEQAVLCEFEVERTTNFKEWPKPRQSDKTKLSLYYKSSGALKTWTEKENVFFGEIEQEGCNPDDIQFESTGNESEQRMKVDGHRFVVACPAGWRLSAKWAAGASAYSPVASLACTALPAEEGEDPVFAYQVTASDGATTIVDDSSNLLARCTQKRCLACPAVPCGEAPGCVAPAHTPGAGDACAKLECEGNRFEIPDGQSGWKRAEGQPACTDGQWAMDGTQFAKARCFKTCPPLKCAGCKVNSTTATCTNGNEMRITNGGNSKSAARLDCDSATGKWKGAAVGPSASISCESKTDEQIGTAGFMTTPLQNSIVVAAVLSLLIIIGSAALWYWRHRKQKAKTASDHKKKSEQEKASE